MDLVTLDVTEVADRIAVGDWMELLGERITLDEIAALARTIGYEILTGLSPRVPRIYRG
jgi:alanine racemase